MDPAPTSPHPPTSHTAARRAILLAILVLLVATISLFGDEAWYWISTEPDDAPQEVRMSGLFEWIPELPGKARILRWGDDAGGRHGPYLGERDGFTLTGRYDRGIPVGIWQLREGEQVVREAWGIDIERVDSGRVDSGRVELLGVVVRRWGDQGQVEGVLVPELVNTTDLVGAMRLPSGAVFVGPLSLQGQITDWEFDTPAAIVEPDGTIYVFEEHEPLVLRVAPGGARQQLHPENWVDPLEDEAKWRRALAEADLHDPTAGAFPFDGPVRREE